MDFFLSLLISCVLSPIFIVMILLITTCDAMIFFNEKLFGVFLVYISIVFVFLRRFALALKDISLHRSHCLNVISSDHL